MRRIRHLLAPLLLLPLLGGCTGDDPSFELWGDRATSRVHTDRTYLRDAHDRYLVVNGVNVGGSTKVPFTVDPLSYVGRPFPLDSH